jgi:hypothetical protein
MVEIGYALKDLTRYIIGSEDEIRIVNTPPGSFQIRGIRFEEPLRAIQTDPGLSIHDIGKITVDSFIDQYMSDVSLKDQHGKPYLCRYSATMALINARALDQLGVHLNEFAGYINEQLRFSDGSQMLLKEIQASLSKTQRYPSFMNLEYYDLRGFLQNLADKTKDKRLRDMCLDTAAFIKSKVVVYEKHTADCASNGLSIYFSNYVIPENIYKTHQQMYQMSEFSKDTVWDEMIENIRSRMRERSGPKANQIELNGGTIKSGR